MKRSSLLLASTGLFIAAVVGCQTIAGLQTRATDPLLTGCNLPAIGNGSVRLVNVAAKAGNTDFCIRMSGTSSWGRPIFRDGGNDILCLGTTGQPGGLAYTQATVPFNVPVGKIDVKAVPAGSGYGSASGDTCAAAGTSEIDGVTVGDAAKGGKPVVTLVRYGGGVGSKEGLSALPEAVNLPAGSPAYRVVNALSGKNPISWGLTSSSHLPATVETPVETAPILPGAASSVALLGTLDPSGYWEFTATSFNIAAAYAGDTSRKALTLYTTPRYDQATLYVIGDPNDTQNLHPVTGLYCEDKAVEPYDAGTGDAGPLALTPQDTGLLESCKLAQLSSFSVNMVNVSLYGANAPFEAQRRQPIYNDIAARTSDFMCIIQADDIKDRTGIAAAAKAYTNPVTGGPGQFQYSYMVTTSQTTPPSDPNDVRPSPANPPCGASAVYQPSVDDIYKCVEQNCSTTSGGDPLGTGTLNGTTQCMSLNCATKFGAILTNPLTLGLAGDGGAFHRDYLGDYCFDCAIYYFTDFTEFSTGQQNCTTQSAPPFAFGGQTPIMILSHYPILTTTAGPSTLYNFPSTGYREGLLKAQVQIEGGNVIDFFCGSLSSPLTDASLPYTGSYGSDVLDGGGQANGWEQEQDLQAREALTWIEQQVRADKVPAILAIDLHSDDPPSSTGDDAGALSPIAPEVIDLFNAASFLTPAVVPGAAPFCDYCTDNPYNTAGTPPNEALHAYLSGFPANATQTETIWGDDTTEVPLMSIPFEPAPASGTGPLFEFWAHNYTILRPTATAGADAGAASP